MNRFDAFKHNAQQNIQKHREAVEGNGGFEYNDQVKDLIKLSNRMNRNLMVYLFGDQMGNHLISKFWACDHNLLRFLSIIDSEYRFFILHELKTNQELFAHG